jgi:putative ABC transport system ATP-binding protein
LGSLYREKCTPGDAHRYNGFIGSMSLPRLELRRASKTYQSNGQSLRALYDVSFTVEAGSVTALVGRSGCGKTTLLNLAGAMDFPTSGDVLIDGQSTSALSESALTTLRRKRIGFVFQFFQLLPALTVLENVELPLLLAGAPDSRTAARERLEWVGLEDKASVLPYQLSGGQAQRTAIARALAHSPDIVIADEPTGNLDTVSGEQVLNLIRESAEKLGAAVLMATHSSEAAAIAQTQIRMRDGHIEETIRA